jgi:hypothetical protein
VGPGETPDTVSREESRLLSARGRGPTRFGRIGRPVHAQLDGRLPTASAADSEACS